MNEPMHAVLISFRVPKRVFGHNKSESNFSRLSNTEYLSLYNIGKNSLTNQTRIPQILPTHKEVH
jgi:hypothetical protein